MEVHQLRYFCAVSETGSFTRAAEREQVAQPSLSQQIMKLEEELGVRLLIVWDAPSGLPGLDRYFCHAPVPFWAN